MSTSRTRILALVALLCLALAACGEPADDAAEPADPPADDEVDETVDAEDVEDEAPADVVSLVMASYQPPGAPWRDAYEWWAEEIEAQTDGTVEIEIFDNEALLTQDAIMPGVRDGRADIGYFVDVFHPAELPLSNISAIPFITGNAEVQGLAFWELYETYEPFRAEYHAQNLEVAFFLPSTGNVLSSQAPIDGPDELVGRDVRALGYVSDALAAIGAQPVTVTLGEMYESLERGVIDANLTVFENLGPLGIHEVAPYVADVGTGLFVLPVLAFNKAVWDNQLNDEQREVIRAVSAEGVQRTLDEIARVGEVVCDDHEQAGGAVQVWSEESVQSWADQIVDDLLELWREEASGRGAPADEFLDLYLEAIERHEAASDYVPSTHACAERFQ